MRTIFLLLTILLLAGCETYMDHDVRFEATAMNHTPPIEIDISEMPTDWIEKVSESRSFLGNKKQVYRLHGPVRITITPWDDAYAE